MMKVNNKIKSEAESQEIIPEKKKFKYVDDQKRIKFLELVH
jgi:hypothetical protein